MTGEDETQHEQQSGVNDGTSSENEKAPKSGGSAPSRTDWESLIDAFRTRLQERIAIWPEKVSETIDLVDGTPSPDVPEDREILIYVHGYLSQGRIEGMNISGANQAAALRQSLANEYQGTTASPPAVVAGMWNSSTTWPRATKRAVAAGKTLAAWVTENAETYDRITLLGHSLGGRVVLIALNHLEEVTVDSAGVLGAAVLPKSVYTEYRPGIESGVENGVFNYYSRNDDMVCRLYGIRAGQKGIGCNGTRMEAETGMGALPAKYVDVDVSERVHRHVDYYIPQAETAVSNCVREIVDRQLDR